jgi:type IV pilus assembly protein PilA
MKKLQQGFTLIELMIVVVIIGILVAIAIPQYQDYIIRARAAEGLSLAASAKTAVAETFSAWDGATAIAAYNGTDKDPGSNSYGYTFTPTNTVASIAIAGITKGTPVVGDGAITVTYDHQVAAAMGTTPTLILTPGSGTVTGGAPASALTTGQPIVWGCSVGIASAFKYVPADCRNMAPKAP